MTEQNFPSYDEAVNILKTRDKKLRWLIEQIGPLSHVDQKDDYLFLTEQIVGQMLSIRVADVMIERLEDLCGGAITPDTICSLSADVLKNTGISLRKAECIRQIACMVNDGSLDFRKLKTLSDEEIVKSLTAIKGIGNWTTKMYLYKINRPDVLPYEDATFLAAYKWLYRTKDIRKDAVMRRCRKWVPYSSVAAMYLYAAFERNLTMMETPTLKELEHFKE